MKAISHDRYGTVDVLRLVDIPVPRPGEGEVLIKVHATTVNRTDCGFRAAAPAIVRLFSGLFRPKQKILGNEFAGEIVETGKGVTRFAVGDKVFGLTGNRMGAHAEYLCLPAKGPIELKPAGMTYEQAAAVCDGVLLALTYIRAVKVKPGDEVLVYGASGSIGTAGVQLAKYFGAKVTAVCGSNGVQLLRALGADRVVDYQTQDFTRDAQRYDFVFDAVGRSSFGVCRGLLKPRGIYAATEFGDFLQNPVLALWTAWFSQKKVIFPLPDDAAFEPAFITKMVEEGRYTAVIDRFYPLEQVVEATRYVESEQKLGNVVIRVTGESGEAG